MSLQEAADESRHVIREARGAFCTRSRTGRTIHRHRDQELLDRARRIANSKAA
jgi:hypothetical protein